MDYKYADESGKWFIQIDDNGLRSQPFTKDNKPGLYREMEAWKAEGNEIEPFLTAEEQVAKDFEEQKAFYEGQISELLGLIQRHEFHLLHKPDEGRRFSSQYSTWLTAIKEWDSQVEQVKAQLDLFVAGKDPGKPITIEPEPVF